jgi:hypothetical protein
VLLTCSSSHDPRMDCSLNINRAGRLDKRLRREQEIDLARAAPESRRRPLVALPLQSRYTKRLATGVQSPGAITTG